VCRKCYVHPAVIETYLAGGLALDAEARATRGLRREEVAVLAFLRQRLQPKHRRQSVMTSTKVAETRPAVPAA
jgi:DNA topoisomerase IB